MLNNVIVCNSVRADVTVDTCVHAGQCDYVAT